MEWHCETFRTEEFLIDFLNEKEIKPENCKITEYDDWFTLFYYA